MLYLTAAVVLTLLWLITRTLAPTGGLTRSYYYPLPRDANPLALDLATSAGVHEAAADVDLDFLAERGRPTRDYLVRWQGVWYSPRAERIDFRAGADDGVVVRLDGETVLERHPAVGMHSEARSVELGAGAHELQIDHWQRGGARLLIVQWAPAGGEPEPLGPARMFPSDPGAAGYWLFVGSSELAKLVLLVWIGGPALLFVRMARRQAAALTAREARRRLSVAAFPALLAPVQVLLFGPWTVHATNRTEFLAPFGSLAARWLWLPVVTGGVLAALGLVLPSSAFRRYVAGLCAVGVLLWFQGSLLVADYGLLDGAGLDLTPRGWRIPLESALWIGGVGLAVAFAGSVVRAAPTASVLLMTLQAAVLLLPGLALFATARKRRILDSCRPQDVVVAGASSDRQVPRVLAGVKARRCAPPPLSRGSRP